MDVQYAVRPSSTMAKMAATMWNMGTKVSAILIYSSLRVSCLGLLWCCCGCC